MKNIRNILLIIIISFSTTVFTLLVVGVITAFIIFSNKNFIKDSLDDYIKIDTNINGNHSQDGTIVDIVESANPAVVSIIITKDIPKIEQYYQYNYGIQIPRLRQNGTEKKEVGGGSGFFVSSDGYIITNKHVVNDATAEYSVLTNDGKSYTAKVLAKDPIIDIAVLKIEGSNFSYLTFADSSTIKSGQTVIAIGNALGEYRNSVSVGVVSGLSRSIVTGDLYTGTYEQLDNIIQTDVGINPGNSGGPLLDLNGKVVGVNVAIESNAENISFSIPSNIVEDISNSVKQYGEIITPYIGIRYIQIDNNVKDQHNLSVDYGVLIIKGKNNEDGVVKDSPAYKAGLLEGDIILEIDDIKLDGKKSLASIIRGKGINQTLNILILRSGKEMNFSIKTERTPKS